MVNMENVSYPYIPINRSILYVPVDNPYMVEAKKYAKEYSLDTTMPTASVIVMDGVVIGRGANGSDYHLTHECERVKKGVPTGQRYELCEGCHPRNHSEPRALINAQANGYLTKDADLYLWGHWWACKPCWDALIASGVQNVYLMEGSEKLFNKMHPDNIVGAQFV